MPERQAPSACGSPAGSVQMTTPTISWTSGDPAKLIRNESDCPTVSAASVRTHAPVPDMSATTP